MRLNTCKNRKRSSVTTTDSGRNKFDALASVDSQDESEETKVNSVEVAQEIADTTVDSSAAKSVWPIQKKGVVRTKSQKEVKMAAACGSAIRVEGDAKLEFLREGKRCCMKCLDADVNRPLASVSSIVDDGNKFVFGQQESYIENESTGLKISDEPEEGRVYGVAEGTGRIEVEREDVGFKQTTRGRFVGPNDI